MKIMATLACSPEDIASEGLKPDEYEEIVRRLGRHPNRAELGMFGVMWSEHCCYKNSRPLLSQFPTEGDRILVGPGENAGVIDVGNGMQVAFKIESHNHPSAIEPFQGAATGVGGILRDIFTMGARPIAVLNSLRFGNLEDARTRQIFTGVVSGIAHYGNCFGVPTIGGEVFFDEAYSGNPLVNAMAIGLMETNEIVKSGAVGIGNPVLYVGSTTGRDGMGGASFASAELSDESEANRPAVQVGDPFLEKSLVEACLEAFKTGGVAAAQDMGAAGITCSTAEMAANGGVGIELDLDLIPEREPGMVPYEYLLSESQERMLFVAHAGREQELIEIFHRWGLQAVVAGAVIEEPIVRILFEGKVAAEIPATALSDNTPIYKRELMAQPPEYAQTAWAWQEASLPAATAEGINGKSWNQLVMELLGSPTIASKQWVYRQYDHQVQNNTVMMPGGADAAVIRLRFPTGETPPTQARPDPKTNAGLAATVDCNARYVYLNPYEGALAAVAEAARNLSCVGAEPVAVTDNLNFGSPEKPIGYWQLAEACRGLAEGCRKFSTPVTGGNVSLYNETLDSDGKPQPIYPTPVVGMVGLIPDLSKVCGQAWQAEGDVIYLLGVATDRTGEGAVTLGGSEYLKRIHGLVAGQPPKVNVELELAVQAACRHGIRQGWIRTAHDCSEGGLAIALAESCISGEKGANVSLPIGQIRLDTLLFGEGGGRILVAIAPNHQSDWEQYYQAHLSAVQPIGTVGSLATPLTITCVGSTYSQANHSGEIISLAVSALADQWTHAIEKALAQSQANTTTEGDRI
jgi:phosphoribosylformylglycinamidine synthase subunit PurL